MRRIVLSIAIVLAASCSSSRSDDGAPTTHVEIEPVVLGHFETREHKLTWLVGDDGPRFTICTRDGELLAADLSPSDVEARFPALGDFVRSALAGDARAVLDASSQFGY
jgi:hypothetical protein